MNILIATPLYPPEIGGPATYSKLLEDELPKRGFEVALSAYAKVRHFGKGIAHLAYFFEIFKAAYGKDLVYILDPSPAMLPAALAAMLRAKPYVLKIVGDIAWEQGVQRYGVKENLDEFVEKPDNKFLFQVVVLRSIQRFIARHAQTIIVPSEYLKRIVCTWGVPREGVRVVYNSFEIPEGMPAHDIAKQRLHIEGTILFSAGRLVPWKGFGTLIRLMPTLKKEFGDLKLFIAGSGPLEADLKKLIVEENLSESVILLGNVPHEKLLEYIAASDCFVLNTGYEGLSHQLLEVLAVGTPIVTTNVGGNPELIEHEKTGLLVEHDDHSALSHSVQRILTEKDLAMRLVDEGKRFAARFPVSATVDGAAEILNNAVLRP